MLLVLRFIALLGCVCPVWRCQRAISKCKVRSPEAKLRERSLYEERCLLKMEKHPLKLTLLTASTSVAVLNYP